MRKLGVLVSIEILVSSCSEVVGFGIASVNLFFALMKIVGILLVILLVIGIISNLFNRNK